MRTILSLIACLFLSGCASLGLEIHASDGITSTPSIELVLKDGLIDFNGTEIPDTFQVPDANGNSFGFVYHNFEGTWSYSIYGNTPDQPIKMIWSNGEKTYTANIPFDTCFNGKKFVVNHFTNTENSEVHYNYSTIKC